MSFLVILYLIFELTEAERRKPHLSHLRKGFMGYPSLYPPPGISVLQNTMIREGWPLGIFFNEDIRGKMKKGKEK